MARGGGVSIKVKVYNNDRVARQFKALGFKTRDLSAAFARIGAEVAKDARPLTPFLSGRLVNSIRVGKTKTSGTVRAGTKARVPYAAVQHYGGYHNIEAKPFLSTALYQNRDFATAEIDSEVHRLIREVGLS